MVDRLVTYPLEKVIENTVPTANNLVKFKIEGPGEIIATANGDPTDLVPFPSHERETFNGLALIIIRSQLKDKGFVECLGLDQKAK